MPLTCIRSLTEPCIIHLGRAIVPFRHIFTFLRAEYEPQDLQAPSRLVAFSWDSFSGMDPAERCHSLPTSEIRVILSVLACSNDSAE